MASPLEIAQIVALLRATDRPWSHYSSAIDEHGSALPVLEEEHGLLAGELADAELKTIAESAPAGPGRAGVALHRGPLRRGRRAERRGRGRARGGPRRPRRGARAERAPDDCRLHGGLRTRPRGRWRRASHRDRAGGADDRRDRD